MSSWTDKIDLNLTGLVFTDELHTDVGVSAFELDHDWFWGGADLAIRTASGGGGTLLEEGTHYLLSVEDADLTARSGKTVYGKVQIIDATYQSGDLYFSGKYIADSIEASDINEFGFIFGNQLINTFAKWQKNLLAGTSLFQVKAWDKSLTAVAFSVQPSTGTADTDTTDHLVDSGADFVGDGVAVGDVVRNTTDNVFATVQNVAATDLTLDWDAFPDGNEAYIVYDEPELPGAIVECNGQTISDAESPINGETLRDLNGEGRFLRGGETSGIEQADAFQGHWHDALRVIVTGAPDQNYANPGGVHHRDDDYVRDPSTDGVNGTPRTAAETRSINMSVVWIMRIK